MAIAERCDVWDAGRSLPSDADVATNRPKRKSESSYTTGVSEIPGRFIDFRLTSNVSDVRKVSLVMKGGTVYYPAEVYEAIGVRRFEDPPQVTPAN